MKLVMGLMVLMLATGSVKAQDDDEKTEKKKGTSISIGPDGIDVESNGKTSRNGKTQKADKDFSVEFAMIDLGINSLMDNTNYASAATKDFLQVPSALQNENLFDLRTGKSWNVNIWPVMGKVKILRSKRQKIYFSTGIGLQFYNLRYSKDIKYINETTPAVVMDSMLTKNKLVVNYLSIPLQLTFKTKMASKLWLVYGVGVTGGFRVDSWTKTIAPGRGKEKNHDSFNLSDFNSCVTAEFGLDNYFRVYASYQLTNMYENALDQRPFCIGLRFGGI